MYRSFMSCMPTPATIRRGEDASVKVERGLEEDGVVNIRIRIVGSSQVPPERYKLDLVGRDRKSRRFPTMNITIGHNGSFMSCMATT